MEELFKAKLSSNQLDWLETSLKTRAAGLDRRLYSLQDLDEYSNKSLVPILWCINEVIRNRGQVGENEQHSLDHLGKAQVTLRRLKGFLKALIVANPQAEQFVPISLLGKFSLNGPKMIKSLKSAETEKLTDVVHEMASHAHSHLSLTKATTPFLKLSKYSSERFLKVLEKNNFSISNPKIQIIGSQKDGLLPIKLFFKTLF